MDDFRSVLRILRVDFVQRCLSGKFAPFFLWAALLAGGGQEAACGAEEFVLADGGRVAGELLNPNQVPRTDFLVKTPEGVVFKIDRTQVAQRLARRAEEVEYEAIWPHYADTVEAQWELAEWCRERTLTAQRERHLKRILQLDPDHEQARRGLGYVTRDGAWTTRDDELRNQGYVYFEGQWRTAQEVQLIEEDRITTKAQNEWLAKLKQYRDQLASSNSREARAAILQMNDPHAVKALAKALEGEANENIRQLYLEALGNVATPAAAKILAAWYLREPLEELRMNCLDRLKGNRNAVDFFAGLLGSSDNREVNHAAAALAYLGDPSAIDSLIRALVTVHKFRVKKGNPGQTSATFGSGGGGGLAMGGSDEIVSRPITNRGVLDALVSLSGGSNFGYDVDAWKAWAAGRRPYQLANPRRD